MTHQDPSQSNIENSIFFPFFLTASIMHRVQSTKGILFIFINSGKEVLHAFFSAEIFATLQVFSCLHSPWYTVDLEKLHSWSLCILYQGICIVQLCSCEWRLCHTENEKRADHCHQEITTTWDNPEQPLVGNITAKLKTTFSPKPKHHNVKPPNHTTPPEPTIIQY